MAKIDAPENILILSWYTYQRVQWVRWWWW